MEHQGSTAILKHLSVVDITGPLLPHGLSDMCPCNSEEGKVMDDAFQHKPILHSILNYDHDTMTHILRAHGVKHMTLDAGREFGSSIEIENFENLIRKLTHSCIKARQIQSSGTKLL